MSRTLAPLGQDRMNLKMYAIEKQCENVKKRTKKVAA